MQVYIKAACKMKRDEKSRLSTKAERQTYEKLNLRIQQSLRLLIHDG